MWKFGPSVLMAVAGVVCVTPLFATVCGPQTVLSPGQCVPAHVNTPEAQGSCVSDGASCYAINCDSTSQGIAVAGVCSSEGAEEVDIGKCQNNTSTIMLQVEGYKSRCSGDDGKCSCLWMETGETSTIEVCNCTNL